MSIFAPRPSHDLILVAFEHDDRRIPERCATNSGVGVIGHVVEATKDDVIGDDVDKRIWVLRDATRDGVD